MNDVASRPTAHQGLKRLLLALLFALLLLPALQAKFGFAKLAALGGYSEPAPRADFSTEALLNNTFQTGLEKYLEDRIGFREWMIRLRNQLAYSLFKLGRANNTVVGEDDILFDGNAIDTDLGKNFVGEQVVARNVRRLRDVQDTLARHGTLLVFAIAPGKSGVYRDQQPAYYRRQAAQRSTYAAYAEKMAAAGVNVLDYGALFRQWRHTSKYPIFPRGGIHWSLYGRDLAVDTLFGYLRQHGRPNFPDTRMRSIELSKEPRDTDNDIAKALNLFREPEAFLMAYPNLEFKPLSPGQRKPNVLLIADSFGYGLVPYLPAVVSQESRFWYYNELVAWAGTGEPPEGNQVRALDLRSQLHGRDVVLLLYTEPNLLTFDHGFIDNAYQLFHPYSEAENAQIKRIEEQLQADTTVANRVWRQSYKDNIDPKAIFYREARAIFDKER